MATLHPICPDCGKELEVSIGYDGCDWLSEAGEGSGFKTCVSLRCTGCPRIFSAARVRDFSDVSRIASVEQINKRRAQWRAADASRNH